MKLVALLAEPPAVVTDTTPVLAPAGTLRRSEVALRTVNEAVTPVSLTAMAAPTLAPLTVTKVPTGPLVAVSEVTVGSARPDRAYETPLMALPPGVVTVTLPPVIDPLGTPTTILVDEMTVSLVADTVPNFTEVARLRFVPVIVTARPMATEVGVMPVTVGRAA